MRASGRVLIGICMFSFGVPAAAAAAQQQAGAQNPVIAAARQIAERQEKNLVGAAENMPPEKYSYKPTPAQQTFGHWVAHSAESNFNFCSHLSGAAAPEIKPADTDPKEKLVTALKSSFDFCSASLAKLNDSDLGQQAELFGGRKGSKAMLLLILTNGWSDHYANMANYLRLNGLLPPTAQQK